MAIRKRKKVNEEAEMGKIRRDFAALKERVARDHAERVKAFYARKHKNSAKRA